MRELLIKVQEGETSADEAPERRLSRVPTKGDGSVGGERYHSSSSVLVCENGRLGLYGQPEGGRTTQGCGLSTSRVQKRCG